MRLRRALGAAAASLLVPLVPLAAPSPAAAAPPSSGTPGVLSDRGHVVTPAAASTAAAAPAVRAPHQARYPGRLTATKQRPAAAGPATSAQPQVSQPSSPLVSLASFAGTAAHDQAFAVEPPDGAVAASATQVVEMVNAQVRITSKTGQSPTTLDLDSLFMPNSLPPGAATSDPRVQWDQATGKFWASVVVLYDVTDGIAGDLRVAYSNTSDATGSWTVTVVLPENNDRLPDQPRLSVTTDKVLVAWDEFHANGAPIGGRFRVVDKADLIAKTQAHVFDATPDGRWWGLVPAVPTTGSTTAWLVYNGTCTNYNPDPTLGPDCPSPNYVGVLKVTGTPGAVTTAVTPTDVPFSGTWIPPNAPQPGASSPQLDTGDDRFNTAAVQGNQLWASGNDCSQAPSFVNNSHFCPPGARSAIRLVGIDVGATPSLFTADPERVVDPTSAVFYGGVAPDAAGDLVTGFSVSSASLNPSMGVTARLTNGTILPLVLAQTGGGAYAPTEPQGQAPRWGDYAGAAQDPNNPTDVWVEAEWKQANNASPSDWSTGISRLKVLPTITALSPPSDFTGGGDTITITGSGFTAATTVSFGATPGTGVTVLSPNQLTVTAPAHGVGTVNVTVTTESGTSTSTAPFRYSNIAAPTNVTATGGLLSATISWSPPSTGTAGLTSYTVRAYSGATVANTKTVTGTPPATSTTMQLAPGTYTFTVDASDGTDTSPESSPSTPTSVHEPVQVSSVSPNQARTHTGRAIVHVFGSGFTPQSTVSFSGQAGGEQGVSVAGVSFVSGSQLDVDARFSNASARRAYDVTVNDPVDGSATCGGCFTLVRSGYWMVGADGAVYAFGDAPWLGGANQWIGPRMGAGVRAVALVVTANGDGYCVVDTLGESYCFNAGYPNVPAGSLQPGEQVTSASLQPHGSGIWYFTNRGRVFAMNGAPSFGDMSGTALNGPVLGSVATPTGQGYYMVASDGGVFSFGDARFHGSMGGRPLNGPVQGLAPTPDNAGYWLVASDGGIFAFDAPFRGSMGGRPLNKPVIGMVPFGNGYLMVASDGGIFDFSDRPFDGSLGSNPPAVPVVNVAPMPS